MNVTASANAGGGVGSLDSSNKTTLSQSGGRVIVAGSEGPLIVVRGGSGGVVVGRDVNSQNTTLGQVGVDAEVSGRLVGIGGELLNPVGYSASLYAGRMADDHTPVVNSTLNSDAITGLLDTAGYPPNNVRASGNMVSLNTTSGTQWQTARETFCQQAASANPSSVNQSTCHYPYEQLHTLLDAGNNTLLLVSRQRYPFNAHSDGIGRVRISRVNYQPIDDVEQVVRITPDLTFGQNGTQVYGGAQGNITLPGGVMPLAEFLGPNDLTALYLFPCNASVDNATANELLFARFPLGNDGEGSVGNYTTGTTTGTGGEAGGSHYETSPAGYSDGAAVSAYPGRAGRVGSV